MLISTWWCLFRYAFAAGTRAVQVYSGCVIWARDEAELRAAAEEERQRLEEVMRSKRRERLKNAWRLLVKNVLLDIYVAGMFLLLVWFFLGCDC